MVSEFRKKKIMHIFNSWFDTDQSGTVNKHDMDMGLKKISEFRGLKPGDPKYNQLKEILDNIWEGLKMADSDGDGEVTADEWLQQWADYGKNPGGAAAWQKLICKSAFQLRDTGNDGAIDSDEYVAGGVAMGKDKQETIELFKKISNGKDKITYEEYEALFNDFFGSDNPDAPGSFLFGFIKN